MPPAPSSLELEAIAVGECDGEARGRVAPQLRRQLPQEVCIQFWITTILACPR
jgi:hypothetical protein